MRRFLMFADTLLILGNIFWNSNQLTWILHLQLSNIIHDLRRCDSWFRSTNSSRKYRTWTEILCQICFLEFYFDLKTHLFRDNAQGSSKRNHARPSVAAKCRTVECPTVPTQQYASLCHLVAADPVEYEMQTVKNEEIVQYLQ